MNKKRSALVETSVIYIVLGLIGGLAYLLMADETTVKFRSSSTAVVGFESRP